MTRAAPSPAAAVEGPAEAVIEVRDLSFAYGQTSVLQGVTFTVNRNDFVGMVGPNGGGKTTLLRLLLGLLEPTSGTVRVFGRPPAEVRRRIGYMPQHAQLDPQFPMRAIDVVLMGRLGGWRVGWFGPADRARAHQLLAEVGLAGVARRPLASLSGGQRQRVLIARALACEPELLLMDEPTANLDPLVQEDVNELLHELNRRLTIILVSHDVGFVTRYIRSVICVNRQVRLHSADAVTGESIRDLYGFDVHYVQHGHGDGHGHGH
jgi:zinc transport system ATP-binding protein